MQPMPQAQPWQPMPAHGQGMQPVVTPKNVALCVILSVLIPGLGSIVAGNTGTGVLILVLYIVAAILSIFLIGIPFAIGIWVWGMVDAYKSAQKWNEAHGILS
jgi:TM2 domain-containing membrane protein YozV